MAQWIEQQIPVLWVGGSNPSALVTCIRLNTNSKGYFLSWDKPNLPYEKEWQRIVWNTKISVRMW